jgi:hypothetical protein
MDAYMESVKLTLQRLLRSLRRSLGSTRRRASDVHISGAGAATSPCPRVAATGAPPAAAIGIKARGKELEVWRCNNLS